MVLEVSCLSIISGSLTPICISGNPMSISTPGKNLPPPFTIPHGPSPFNHYRDWYAGREDLATDYDCRSESSYSSFRHTSPDSTLVSPDAP